MPKSMNKIDGADWVSGQGIYLAAQEVIETVDILARGLEAKWGVGALRLLVPEDLRERFDRQRLKFDRAIWQGPLETLRQEAQRMANGWRALDQWATAHGLAPAPVEAFEALLDGCVLVITRTDQDALAYRPRPGDDRTLIIWSAEEVARLLSTHGQALIAAKQTFPGAVVEGVRRPASDPVLSAGEFDDPIPF